MTDELLQQARDRLARGDAAAAVALFAQAHEAAVAAGDPAGRARALLGRAQAEFGCGQLALAAQHADAAHDLLVELGLPEAPRAADLIAQIAHYQHLR